MIRLNILKSILRDFNVVSEIESPAPMMIQPSSELLSGTLVKTPLEEISQLEETWPQLVKGEVIAGDSGKIPVTGALEVEN